MVWFSTTLFLRLVLKYNLPRKLLYVGHQIRPRLLRYGTFVIHNHALGKSRPCHTVFHKMVNLCDSTPLFDT
jgi:hypothetical protein